MFYTEENCPGLGCDLSLFDTQLAGCGCVVCGDDCPCGGATVGTETLDDASVSDASGIDVATGGRPLVECNFACACGPECVWRVIQRGPRPGLSVFDAGARGLGLRTDQAIPRGAFVCCYAGEVVGAAEAARRFAAQTDHNYILAVREHCAGRVNTTFIDATQVCNIGHYANHSCRPNMRLRPVRVDSPVPHAALFAVRNISAGGGADLQLRAPLQLRYVLVHQPLPWPRRPLPVPLRVPPRVPLEVPLGVPLGVPVRVLPEPPRVPGELRKGCGPVCVARRCVSASCPVTPH